VYIQPKLDREFMRDVLTKVVHEDYKSRIDEFLDFADRLVSEWWSGRHNVREKYAYAMNILIAKSTKNNVVNAKKNAYYAYWVYKGYESAYSFMKRKLVAGGESLYTWIRLYTEIDAFR